VEHCRCVASPSTPVCACEGALACFDNPQTTLVAEFQLFCSKHSWSSLLKTLYYVGFLGGSLIAGPTADRYGRRPAFFACWVIMALFFGFSALAPTYWWYAAVQVVIGAATGASFTAAFVLCSEIAPPHLRTRLTIEIWAYMWAIQPLVCALLSYVFDIYAISWRWLIFSLSMPSVFWVSMFCVIPESPRWLYYNGRSPEALCGMMAITDATEEDLKGDSDGGSTDLSPTWGDLFQTFRKTGLFLGVMLMWFTYSCAYFAITFNATNLSDSPQLNLVLVSLPLAPATFLGCRLMNTCGRSIANTTFLLLCAATCFVGALVPGTSLVASMVGTFFANAGFNLAYVWVPELFPTSMRTMCMGCAMASARVGALVAPLLPDVVGSDGTLLVVAILCSITAAVCFPFLPETVGQRLSDQGGDVDGTAAEYKAGEHHNLLPSESGPPTTVYASV